MVDEGYRTCGHRVQKQALVRMYGSQAAVIAVIFANAGFSGSRGR
jgi:hypothetical protein